MWLESTLKICNGWKKDGKLANYAATHDIGKQGVEKIMKISFMGRLAIRKEVNNKGRILRTFTISASEAGQDLYLGIDIRLQKPGISAQRA